MIRTVEEEDSKSIQKIVEISLGYKCSTELVSAQIKKFRDNPYHICFVYENENHEAVGYIEAEVYESLYSQAGLNILGLAVLPENRREGVARKLVEQLERWGNAHHYQYIRLNSSSSRVEAHKFYNALGYECDKTQKRFIKTLS